MPRKPRAPKQMVAFKVDSDLAAVLGAIPNKSEFIRAAVQARLATACPLCRGTGLAPSGGVAEELTKLVNQHPLVVCSGCGVREPRPCHSPGHCDPDLRAELFERWAVFYCERCFAAAQLCSTCHRPLPRGSTRKSARRLCDACAAH